MKTEHVIVYDNATDLNYTIELFDSNNVWFSLSWKVEYDNFNKHIYMITKIHMNWIVTKKSSHYNLPGRYFKVQFCWWCSRWNLCSSYFWHISCVESNKCKKL